MSTDTHQERAHAKLGGSSALRWANCPGSVFYLDQLPQEQTSEAALKGTAAHEVSEIVLVDFLRHKIEGTDPDIRAHLTCNSEYLEFATGYRDAVWNELLDASITGKFFGIEERLVIDESLDMSGYVDFWCIYIDDRGKRVGCIADFKSGYHKVSVENNSQLAFYACALREEMQRGGKDLDYVRAAIYQPKLKDAYRETKFTAKELDTWKKKFYKAAHQIFVKKKPTFKVGEWCQFCRAKMLCKTYAEKLSSQTSLRLIDPESITLPPPETLSVEQLSKIVSNYDTLKDFIDSCHDFVLNKLKNGQKFDGLKLVEGKSRRKWNDNTEEIFNYLKQNGVENPYKDPTPPELRGITEIEKTLKKLHGKEEAEKMLGTHCSLTKAPILIVPESDPRKEVTSHLGLLDETN